MIRNILTILFSFHLFILDTPVYPIDFAQKSIENYTLRISKKFSNTYCNSTKFGISKDGALRFAIGETNKEFLNNKLNKFIDYEFLNNNILLKLENNCQISDFPVKELENLVFKY